EAAADLAQGGIFPPLPALRREKAEVYVRRSAPPRNAPVGYGGGVHDRPTLEATQAGHDRDDASVSDRNRSDCRSRSRRLDLALAGQSSALRVECGDLVLGGVYGLQRLAQPRLMRDRVII